MATAGTARESKATRTRRRILQAAAHELVERGYAGASLRRIAEGAELQLGSLYFHFETKDQLMLEVLRDAVDFALEQLNLAIAQAGPAAPTGDRIRAAIAAHIQTLHSAGDRGAAVANGPRTFPAEVRRRYVAQVRRYTQAWDELLAAAQDDGTIDGGLDRRAVRELLMWAMNGTVSRRPRDTATLAQAAETLSALLLRR
ncbi:MAG: TetR/AcrR family transcriptional regulator [Solirubrobacteraceae bacterium]